MVIATEFTYNVRSKATRRRTCDLYLQRVYCLGEIEHMQLVVQMTGFGSAHNHAQRLFVGEFQNCAAPKFFHFKPFASMKALSRYFHTLS